MIYAGWRCEFALLDVNGWVAFARALRPVLVALNTLQRARSGRTAWATIFGDIDVTSAIC